MSTGRNARRKLAKRVRQQAERMAEESRFSGSGSPGYTGTDPALLGERLRKQVSALYVEKWTKDLKNCVRLLGTVGAWQYLETHANEANALRLGDTLRAMVVEAAAKFVSASSSNLLSAG